MAIPRIANATEGTLADLLAHFDIASTAWSTKFCTALASKLIVSTSPGTIRLITLRLDATAPSATYYVHGYSAVDMPANATAISSANSFVGPLRVVHATGTDSILIYDFTPGGVSVATGITIGLSTTEFTVTAAGAYLAGTVLYG